MWNVLLWNALCLVPIVTDMAKKILLGRRYDKPLFIYSRFFGMTINTELFFSDVSLWNQYKYIAFSISLCRILIISYKLLIINGISNETNIHMHIYIYI